MASLKAVAKTFSVYDEITFCSIYDGVKLLYWGSVQSLEESIADWQTEYKVTKISPDYPYNEGMELLIFVEAETK